MRRSRSRSKPSWTARARTSAGARTPDVGSTARTGCGRSTVARWSSTPAAATRSRSTTPTPLAEALEDLPGLDGSTARRLARLGGRANFDPDHEAALFDVGEDLYYAKLDGSEARRLTSTPGPEELAEFSPDGALVAFVRANDLYVVDVATGTERALTIGGTDRVRHGKADWVYYEEIFNRDWKAFWWAPDSKHVAFLEVDDRHVGTHAVLNDLGPARVVEETPYPRAGEPNPHVRLGVVAASGGPVAWADLSRYSVDSFLISGVGWLGPDRAYCYAQNRTQTWLDVATIDPDTGATEVLFRETTGAWVENPGELVALDDGGFLMPSERSGWKHIYKYSKDSKDVVPLTSGEWEVEAIEHAGEGSVFFSAKKEGPLVSGLYRVPLSGGEIKRVTAEEGDHSASVSPRRRARPRHLVHARVSAEGRAPGRLRRGGRSESWTTARCLTWRNGGSPPPSTSRSRPPTASSSRPRSSSRRTSTPRSNTRSGS